MSEYVKEALDIVGIARLGSSESRHEATHTMRCAVDTARATRKKKRGRQLVHRNSTGRPQDFHRAENQEVRPRFPATGHFARLDLSEIITLRAIPRIGIG